MPIDLIVHPPPILELRVTAVAHIQITARAGGSGGGGSGEVVEAGAGLTKSGSRLDVVAADGSIVVAADSMRIGVLQTDAMHGNRGGGSQHAVATTSTAGFMAAADKTALVTIGTQVQANRFPVTLRTTSVGSSDYVEIGIIRFNAAPFAGLLNLVAELEVSASGQTAELQLYNLTDATPIAVVSGTTTTVSKATIAVTLPTNEVLYSMRLRRIGGSTTQYVSCRSAIFEPG